MKQQLLLRAWVHAIAAFFILSIPLWAGIAGDLLSIAVITLLPLFLGYSAYSNFKKATKIDKAAPRQPLYAPSADATIKHQIKFYTRFILIGFVTFPLLTWIIINDLNDLESGAVEYVRIWAPVSFLYERFGYQTAILTVPCLGISVVLGLMIKVHSLKSRQVN